MTIGAAIAAGTILGAQKAFENTDLLIDIRDYLGSIAIFAISLSAIFYLMVGERSGSFLAAIGLLFASLWTLMFLIIISSTTIIGSAASVWPLGIWVRSVFIRFWATASFLRDGLSELPRNFRHLLFSVDLFHSVDLIPEYKDDSRFTSDGLVESVF